MLNSMIHFYTIFSLSQAINRRITLILPLFLLAFGCSSPKSKALQPDKMPYQFQTIMNLEGDDIVLSDLDGNGFTEIIMTKNSLIQTPPISYIQIKTFEGKIIEQVNYSGRIVNQIFTLDSNDDGILEVLVPYVRNDSLFVSGVNHRGEKLFHFFLIDGKPRIENSGVMSWDPEVNSFYISDLDHDSVKELITVITTGYARLPRGILVHSILNGELIDKLIIGSPPRDNLLDDFDGDGQLELISFGTAPNNGAKAGGFDDQTSYLIRFDITPDLQVARKQKISNKFSYYRLLYEDIDGDSKKDLLAWTECYGEQKSNSKIIQLDPITFKEKKKWSTNKSLTSAFIMNLDRDAQPEIIALRSPNEIFVLNSHFDEIKHRTFPLNYYSLKVIPDLDYDGIDEILGVAEEGDFLLDTNLKIKATFPEMHCMGVVYCSKNLLPRIVVKNKDQYAMGLLIKNKLYLINRYYLIVYNVLLAGFVLSCGIYIIDLRLRNRLLADVQSLAIDSDIRGFMLIDHHQKIYMMNRRLRLWLDLPGHNKNQKSHLNDVFLQFNEILTFMNETIDRPSRRYENVITTKLSGHRHKIQLIMEPVIVRNKKKPFWLVTFLDKADDDEIMQAKTWCKMAQKAAHDIKNPLSAITLTLQRLQMLNQEQANQTSEKLDLYVTRIIERVESLRRISKNFMKFVNIERLNFVNSDLNQFLIETTNVIRAGLPPDIQLHLKSSNNLPMVKIDQDAIRSVIENLVSNAINALPEGGMITISTQFLQGLTFPGNGQSFKDYILIEVADTGVGIAASDCEHLFEPDFTRTEGGNGLGLAYVKKTVDDHNGYIEVESEPGAGTAFNIYIPTT